MILINVVFIFLIDILIVVKSGYPPTGDEVQAGSVLLPATRRGRYLANIVRRQAVDGTGIKFNKDADRMNADAKKKVDVLSEELLPYIIAEQERRTTLYKRIMTAIQNGEKGVTIAEIRNKPPLIIRKGLMYRCPANRAPKEPDGSGILMCEQDIEPAPVMYDSCLSAEDKELYNADNRYFFCNRHKVEGPDLPRNGSTVIGCAPIERTSLNYTSYKCALEDTDDVVVHYRYYPDRTYKFVTELDPDREVCDHWNPCQIGYIYSLPSPDQATPANELWHDYVERYDEYEKDEIVAPVPEDSLYEHVAVGTNPYSISTRRIAIPTGYVYKGIGRSRPLDPTKSQALPKHMKVSASQQGNTLAVSMEFTPFQATDVGKYFVRFEPQTRRNEYIYVPLVVLSTSTVVIIASVIEALPGQKLNTTEMPIRCNRCIIKSVMLRACDGGVLNLDGSKYRLKVKDMQKYVEIELDETKPSDFGDYFVIVQNEDGTEERIKSLILLTPERDIENKIQVPRLKTSTKEGDHYDKTMTYTCDGCELSDILCNGETVLSGGRISIVSTSKLISFNFPSYEDINSCVYIGIFKEAGKIYKKILAFIDNDSPAVTITNVQSVNAPKEGEQFEHEVGFTCTGDCSVEKVSVNGVPLEASTRRSLAGSFAFYVVSDGAIIIRITEYVSIYEGVYQAVFSTDKGPITKTILEIRDEAMVESDGATTASPDSTTDAAHNASTDTTVDPSGGDTITEGPSSTTSIDDSGDTTTEEQTTPEPEPEPERRHSSN